VCICGAENQTQGLAQAKVSTLPLIYTLPPFLSLFFFETGSHYAAQISLEPTILLPLPPECWYYRYVPLDIVILYHLFFGGTWVYVQGFMLPRQVLYQLVPLLQPFLLWSFFR
jgi:hypothetical protein